MANMPQIRISWRSLTGYWPKRAGKAAARTTTAATPTAAGAERGRLGAVT